MKTPARKYFPVGFSLSSSCQATELTLVILIKQELKTNKQKNPKTYLRLLFLKNILGYFLLGNVHSRLWKQSKNVQSLRRREAKYFSSKPRTNLFERTVPTTIKLGLSHPWTFMHPSQWLGRAEIFHFRLASQLLLHEEVGQSHKKNIL